MGFPILAAPFKLCGPNKGRIHFPKGEKCCSLKKEVVLGFQKKGNLNVHQMFHSVVDSITPQIFKAISCIYAGRWLQN